MRETKTTKLEIRLTNSEKEKIKEYAAAHNKTVSEVVRQLCAFIFEGG